LTGLLQQTSVAYRVIIGSHNRYLPIPLDQIIINRSCRPIRIVSYALSDVVLKSVHHNKLITLVVVNSMEQQSVNSILVPQLPVSEVILFKA
jgi:hypothetical protein